MEGKVGGRAKGRNGRREVLEGRKGRRERESNYVTHIMFIIHLKEGL